MKVCYECLPCIIRQATEASKLVASDETIQKEIIKESIQALGELDFTETAPYLGRAVHALVKEKTGMIDPYLDLKNRYNSVALQLKESLQLKEKIANSEDPFDTACRLAIAGNIIDFSVKISVDKDEIQETLENCLHTELFGLTTSDVKKSIEDAGSILYLCDNAGEIVFDKMFIQQMPLEKITFVVKGGPIVNDATMDDAKAIGLDKVVKVVHNGTDYQGTILQECSEEFQKIFSDSDLIISKGQANFETLSEIEGKKIIFLLKAKCKSIADYIGCRQGEMVIKEIH